MGLECAFFLLRFFTNGCIFFLLRFFTTGCCRQLGRDCPIVDSRHLALDCRSHLRPPKSQLDTLMQAFGGQ